MELLSVRTYFRVLVIMLMVTTYLPVLTNNLPPIIRSHHFWVPIWFFSILLFAPRVLTHKVLLYVLIAGSFLVFILLKTLWVNVDDWNKLMVLDEYYVFSVALSMYGYFRVYEDYEGLVVVLRWVMLFVGITAIMSIYSSVVDPMYARNLVGGQLEEVEEVRRYGGGAYGFAGALVCLFPMIIYYYKNSVKIPFSKPVIAIFVIVCFAALVRMQIFANVLLSVFVITFSLLGIINIRTSILFSVIILLLIILTPSSFLSDTLISIGEYFDKESMMYSKIRELAVYIEMGGGYHETGYGGRAARYPLLWEGFKENPLIGFYNSDSKFNIGPGAHLYWMNKLTVFGILGFIPYILIFYFHFRENSEQFSQEFLFYFVLSALSVIALGLMKNLAGREFWYMYFFIIPGMYHSSLLKNERTGNVNESYLKSKFHGSID
jgi:hypothetical protein